MKHLLLGFLCIFVLGVILTLGLWPFHAPSNEVTWLQDRNGLYFGDYGTVMSTDALDGDRSRDESCSIELWLQPAFTNGSGTILSFYVPNHPLRLSLHQSLTDFMLQSASSPARVRGQRVYVNDVFRLGRPVFVTLTSGVQGTAVYVNGFLARAAQPFRPGPNDCTGRLIVGDSPLQQDTWSGEVRGLAIYSSDLPPATVLRHYHAWTEKGQPEADPNEHIVGLYLFDEHMGNIVHNHAGSSPDLAIPATYTVLDQIFLEPFWDEFNMSWGYWKNLLKNIVGFIPLGFCFYAYFSLVRHYQRAGLTTVILGFAVSLTIEVLQAYLPTRDSGTTDLITNTLGTWLGIMVYHAARAPWERHRTRTPEQQS